ncbi:hypothetical protein UFOVP49_165 [uncultured Caudovirales phage]|uniref:Uncharacterized protein n=1 Tax=uncultured Caudovirales phage TaxID=2100421 RepID=A0A6J5KTU1_9CAUD|nr:hypothetical protein UFOVP49_165 [uncultured Caudovirales phage]
MTDITEKNRSAAASIRRTPMPISEVIPLLTESNDTIEKLRGEVASLKAALKTEEALSFRNQVAQLEAELSAEREACVKLVYGHCESDNAAQRIVDAIRARGKNE